MCPMCMARMLATGAALGCGGTVASLFAMKLRRSIRRVVRREDGALDALGGPASGSAENSGSRHALGACAQDDEREAVRTNL